MKITKFGERRVKLFSLQVEMTSDYQSSVKACVSLMLIHIFSKFNHSVMEVCFLKFIQRLGTQCGLWQDMQLQVSYAPHFESVSDMKEKLEGKRRNSKPTKL
ncbi:uncharacterized protein LOC131251500 isoform X1 [Magnolia sinica]|uniref:uncharacterized protein LOC131251500 isoform X1 n=1 Tax=Magnolia sinica TaxID=86752 RepID=UPI0026593044|nr:uncharacterized protein LOC131251500 isoform X1 [Magnolia sinica]